MKFLRRSLGYIGVSILLCAGAGAQRRQDPLTQQEIDQLRDTAQDPDARLLLYLKFARQHLTAMTQIRSDPKATDRAQQTHDRLQEFTDIYDELNDNLDTYAGQRQDIRKALKAIIQADTEFQAKLRALKDSSGDQTELKQYEFVLSDALDDLDGSVKDHAQLLGEQEEAAKQKKLLKPQAPRHVSLPPG